jgi:hypothetical protein
MKQEAVNWLVYGEWGVPFWAAALGGALFLYIAMRWIRVEKLHRKGILARCLPWTLSLFLILVTLFVWHPVAVRITSWIVPARVVVLADGSASMDRPLAGQDLQSRLEALQFWQPAACEGRPVEARRLLALVHLLQTESGQCLEGLDRFESEAEQGIPPDESPRLRQAALAVRLRHIREEWAGHAEGLARNLDLLSDVPGVGDWKAGVDACQKALDSVLADFEKLPARDAAEALRRLVTALAVADPVLETAQKALDESFLVKNAARLDPLMKEYGTRTRAAAVRQALAAIGSPEIVPEPYDGPREATDLYGLIARALDRHRNESVSQVVLLSDGGHNGPPDAGVLARLKEGNIQFLALGVGVPEPVRPDLAVIDWTAPRIARANRPVTLQAVIRTVAPTGMPYTVKLTLDQAEVASVPLLTDGQPQASVSLSFKAPAAGRHVLRLEVVAAADSDPVNQAAQFGLDTVDRAPELLLIGTTPDWDTAYLRLAAERINVKLTGVFTEGKTPRRGSVGASVPEDADHWFRNQAVILGGRTFQGFSDQDADALVRLVTEKGGTLMILPEPVEGYGQALAARFGWAMEPARLVRPVLRLPEAATRLPLLRLGVDGPQSGRRFAELGPCDSAVTVPAQDRILVESASGEPVCSIGFYGRGKVVMWGIKGVSRMREFEHAKRVDRLLESLLSELAMPVFAPGPAMITAAYPPLPAVGTEVLLIHADTNATVTVMAEGQSPVVMGAGHANRLGRLTVQGPALALTVNGTPMTIPAGFNPGMEDLYPEFNPAFLEHMAVEAGGTYRSLTGAANVMENLAPGRPQIVKTSDARRVGGHPALFLALVLAATLHWALRKLAGLVI